MKYAVIKFNGKQYKVSEKDKVKVDFFEKDQKPEVEVFLVVDEEKVKVGKPTIKDAKVEYKVLEELKKGEKVNVLKYKAKSRYRKHIGFRPQYSLIEIVKIL